MVKCDGDSNVIEFSDVQFAKHRLPICWIDAGIEIRVSDPHESKAFSSIISRIDGCSKVTETSLQHKRKKATGAGESNRSWNAN
jgi:hypothetical protein